MNCNRRWRTGRPRTSSRSLRRGYGRRSSTPTTVTRIRWHVSFANWPAWLATRSTGATACTAGSPFDDEPVAASDLSIRSSAACSGAGGHEGGQDVVRMAVEILAGTVVAHG